MGPGFEMGPNSLGPADLQGLNHSALIRLAVMLAIALLFALAAPAALFAAALSSFLSLAALGFAFMAMLAREPVWQPHLTRWDIAAMLHGTGLLASFFVDSAVVEELLRAHGATPH
jgi:hypothetical protein